MPNHVDLNTICLRIEELEWPQSNVIVVWKQTFLNDFGGFKPVSVCRASKKVTDWITDQPG